MFSCLVGWPFLKYCFKCLEILRKCYIYTVQQSKPRIFQLADLWRHHIGFRPHFQEHFGKLIPGAGANLKSFPLRKRQIWETFEIFEWKKKWVWRKVWSRHGISFKLSGKNSKIISRWRWKSEANSVKDRKVMSRHPKFEFPKYNMERNRKWLIILWTQLFVCQIYKVTSILNVKTTRFRPNFTPNSTI